MEQKNTSKRSGFTALVRRIGAAFSRFARRSPSFSDPRHELGRRGEKLAARELRRQGFKILYRNYRAPGGGEVDLVCRDGEALVFVEVKTRSREDFGAPGEAVTAAKRRLITRGALSWLKLLGRPEIYYRFDIAEVRMREGKAEVALIRNAFTLPEPYR